MGQEFFRTWQRYIFVISYLSLFPIIQIFLAINSEGPPTLYVQQLLLFLLQPIATKFLQSMLLHYGHHVKFWMDLVAAILLPLLHIFAFPPYWQKYLNHKQQESVILQIFPQSWLILSCLAWHPSWMWFINWQMNVNPKYSKSLQNLSYLLLAGVKRLSRMKQVAPPPWLEKLQGWTHNIVQPCAFSTNPPTRSADAISFDSDSYHVFIDTCVTDGITPDKNDFIHGTFVPSATTSTVEGSGGVCEILGRGTVAYVIKDDNGENYTMTIPGVAYAPSIGYRLLSPQYIKQVERETGIFDPTISPPTQCVIDEGFSILRFDSGRRQCTIKHLPDCKVPAILVNNGAKNFQKYQIAFNSIIQNENVQVDSEFEQNEKEEQSSPILVGQETQEEFDEYIGLEQDKHLVEKYNDVQQAVLDDEDEEAKLLKSLAMSKDKLNSDYSVNTLSKDQQELLDIHEKTNHCISIKELQLMAKEGKLPNRLSTCNPPLCPSCLYGKAHKRPWRTKGKHRRHIRRECDTLPGKATSSDTFEATVPGLIPQSTGKLMRDKFSAGTVFVDHATDFGYVHLQIDQTTDSAIEAKEAYERKMAEYDVKVQSYHADNGIFRSKGFQEHIQQSNQKITFCGVGAHFQNGIAENYIKQITGAGRTMLLHAMYRWPEVIKPTLWPYAVKIATENRNRFRRDKNGRTALEKLSLTRSMFKDELNFSHTFGCPCYILDSRLADGNKIPKWDSRVRVGCYLGRSPQHAGSVALVLNPQTGHVSPQFHVVFDDKFTTIDAIRKGFRPDEWEKLCTTSSDLAPEVDFHLATQWETSVPQHEEDHIEVGKSRRVRFDLPHNPDKDVGTLPCVGRNEGDFPITANEGASENSSSIIATNVATDEGECSPPVYNPINLNEVGFRRSTRTRKPTEKARSNPGILKTLGLLAIGTFVAATTITADYIEPLSSMAKANAFYERIHSLSDNTLNSWNPIALATTIADQDTLTLSDARKQPDWPEFVCAMQKEWDAHISAGNFSVIPKSSMNKINGVTPVPIMAVWAFKRKRNPLGEITKYKARLNAHGGQTKEGIHYFDTYAPVVQWVTVRILMILSILENLHNRSIDFVLAFPQADIKVDIYMRLPWGFVSSGNDNFVLHLHKNLYGLKDASKTFWDKVRTDFTDPHGPFRFKQSQIDPCLFMGDNCFVLVYVDDCLVFSRDKQVIDEFFSNLGTKYTITDEGEVAKYLGVDVRRPNDHTYELRQPYLIQRIIETLGLNDSNEHTVPAVKPLLSKDVKGKRKIETWNYRSVQGMLNYLAGSTRPDIAFSVHQTARFANDPKISHERAIKRIGRYLKATKNKGIILKPDRKKGLECYVDADFAGGFDKNNSEDIASVFSRTGFIIKYMDCPIYWVSRLQTEICLSTTEAEYVALSQAMREVLPMISMLKELNLALNIEAQKPIIKCTVFEDNNGAIELASAPRMRPRTKHIALKYHFFRRFIGKTVSIKRIDTSQQIADTLTKPLPKPGFEYLRNKLQGW